ncbi:Tkl protein kinase, variant 2, partial [Globisporangium splendens]
MDFWWLSPYGEVWCGEFDGQQVAIKTLLPDERENIRQINASLAEVKLTRTMKHERIVELIGVAWDSPSDFCVVAEFMEGSDLRERLNRFENFEHGAYGSDYDKVKIALRIAEGLAYLHPLELIVLHRGVESTNVLLDIELKRRRKKNGTPYLHEGSAVIGLPRSFAGPVHSECERPAAAEAVFKLKNIPERESTSRTLAVEGAKEFYSELSAYGKHANGWQDYAGGISNAARYTGLPASGNDRVHYVLDANSILFLVRRMIDQHLDAVSESHFGQSNVELSVRKHFSRQNTDQAGGRFDLHFVDRHPDGHWSRKLMAA